MEIKNTTKFNVRSKACTQRDTVIANAIKERPTQHWNNEKGTQRARPYPVKPQTYEGESMRLSVPRKQPLAEAAAKESQGDMGPFQDGSQTPSAWFWLWGSERCKNEGLGHGFFQRATETRQWVTILELPQEGPGRPPCEAVKVKTPVRWRP